MGEDILLHTISSLLLSAYGLRIEMNCRRSWYVRKGRVEESTD